MAEEGERELGEALPNEEDVIRGGPEATIGDGEAGKEAPGGDAQKVPETVELTIGGQTFHVPKDAAAALESEQTRFTQERDALYERINEPAAAEEPTIQEGVDYSDVIFSDPNAAVASIREDVKKEVLQTVRAETQATNRLEQFWSGFYGTNPDLKDYDSTVRAVMNENWADLRGVSSTQAAKKLADLTKGHITGIVQKFGGTAPSNESVTLEGGSRRAKTVAKTPSNEDDATPPSLSAGIRARRKAQRQSKARAA
jgi:hypothetical protein